MVRILFPILVVAMVCITVVSASFTKGDPWMIVSVCPIGKGSINNSAKCSYTILVRTKKDTAYTNYKLASADCRQAKIENTAFVFQRKSETMKGGKVKTDVLDVQTPCSAGSVDRLRQGLYLDDSPCLNVYGPICASKPK